MSVSPTENTAGAAPETVPQPSESQTTDVKIAESSPADEGAEQGSLLDAVKSALEPAAEQPPGSTGQEEDAEEADANPAEGEAEEELGEVTEEELSRYRPRTKRRIEGLLNERKALQEEAEQLRPKAQQFENLVRYVEEAGLDTQEVNQTFEAARLIKAAGRGQVDPTVALEAIMPFVQSLQALAGQVLPPELQQQVEQGVLSEAHARDLARLRATEEARLSAARQAAEVAARQQAEQSHRATAQVAAQGAAQAVSAWEESWKQSDPDYRLKAGRVREKVELLVMRRQGAPLSPTDALNLAKQARAEVEAEMKAFLPKRQEVRPVTGQAASQSRPQPKTSLEAMKMAIGAA